MATTTVWIPEDLLAKVREMTEKKTARAYHPGLIAGLALGMWADDLWVPGPDVEEKKGESLFLYIEDEPYLRAMQKRRVTGQNISPIIRVALRDWVDGKWDIGLVRA